MQNERVDWPITRRALLQRSGLGLGVWAWPDCWPNRRKHGFRANPVDGQRRAQRGPHFAGKAKRVIHFFLNGGPSHVDTFDPKPLLARYAGRTVPQTLTTERKTGAAFPSPFAFRKYGESGIEVSELFAETARHIDDIAVIRSMYAQVPNHEPSLMLMNCGDSVLPRPSVGAWVLYGMGSENQNLPGFIAMCPKGYPIKDAENWQSGFLPGVYQGTFIDSQYREIDRLIENIKSPHATTSMQRRQLDLLTALNLEHEKTRLDARLDARIQSFELAFRMQTEAAEAFDIAREPRHVREMYGRGVHARQTLIARRLFERGCATCSFGTAPASLGTTTRRSKPTTASSRQIDQPIAALLTDLKRRGMLDDTLVIWGGEFGRTPTVELGGDGKSQLGRDHNHYGFSVWMAGGGIRGGTVHGATDDIGFKAVEKPASVHDLHATILHLLGFDHTRLTYRYAGRDFRLTDVHGRVIDDVLL